MVSWWVEMWLFWILSHFFSLLFMLLGWDYLFQEIGVLVMVTKLYKLIISQSQSSCIQLYNLFFFHGKPPINIRYMVSLSMKSRTNGRNHLMFCLGRDLDVVPHGVQHTWLATSSHPWVPVSYTNSIFILFKWCSFKMY